MFWFFSGKKQGYVYEAGDDGEVLSSSVVTKKDIICLLGLKNYKTITMTS